MDTLSPVYKNNKGLDYMQESRDEFWVSYPVADECMVRLRYLLFSPRKSSFKEFYIRSQIRKQFTLQGKAKIPPKTKNEAWKEEKEKVEKIDMLSHRHRGMLLVGDTNNGKTSILLRFKNLVEKSTYRRSILSKKNMALVSIKDIVYVITPPSRSITLLKCILKEIDKPCSENKNKDELLELVVEGLMTTQAKMLILDEFQNVKEGDKLNLPNLMDMLVYISNRAGVSLILAGIPEIETVISTTSTLRNRLYPFEIPKWNNDEEFQSLLKAIAERWKINCKPDLWSPEVFPQIHDLTEGLIGEVANLLSEVISHEGRDITLESFDKVDWMPPSQRRIKRR